MIRKIMLEDLFCQLFDFLLENFSHQEYIPVKDLDDKYLQCLGFKFKIDNSMKFFRKEMIIQGRKVMVVRKMPEVEFLDLYFKELLARKINDYVELYKASENEKENEKENDKENSNKEGEDTSEKNNKNENENQDEEDNNSHKNSINENNTFNNSDNNNNEIDKHTPENKKSKSKKKHKNSIKELNKEQKKLKRQEKHKNKIEKIISPTEMIPLTVKFVKKTIYLNTAENIPDIYTSLFKLKKIKDLQYLNELSKDKKFVEKITEIFKEKLNVIIDPGNLIIIPDVFELFNNTRVEIIKEVNKNFNSKKNLKENKDHKEKDDSDEQVLNDDFLFVNLEKLIYDYNFNDILSNREILNISMKDLKFYIKTLFLVSQEDINPNNNNNSKLFNKNTDGYLFFTNNNGNNYLFNLNKFKLFFNSTQLHSEKFIENFICSNSIFEKCNNMDSNVYKEITKLLPKDNLEEHNFTDEIYDSELINNHVIKIIDKKLLEKKENNNKEENNHNNINNNMISNDSITSNTHTINPQLYRKFTTIYQEQYTCLIINNLNSLKEFCLLEPKIQSIGVDLEGALSSDQVHIELIQLYDSNTKLVYIFDSFALKEIEGLDYHESYKKHGTSSLLFLTKLILTKVFESKKIVKFFHDARGDVNAIHRELQICPQNVVDTSCLYSLNSQLERFVKFFEESFSYDKKKENKEGKEGKEDNKKKDENKKEKKEKKDNVVNDVSNVSHVKNVVNVVGIGNGSGNGNGKNDLKLHDEYLLDGDVFRKVLIEKDKFLDMIFNDLFSHLSNSISPGLNKVFETFNNNSKVNNLKEKVHKMFNKEEHIVNFFLKRPIQEEWLIYSALDVVYLETTVKNMEKEILINLNYLGFAELFISHGNIDQLMPKKMSSKKTSSHNSSKKAGKNNENPVIMKFNELLNRYEKEVEKDLNFKLNNDLNLIKKEVFDFIDSNFDLRLIRVLSLLISNEHCVSNCIME